MKKEALSWLQRWNTKEVEDTTKWFNQKMDNLVESQNLMQFNNPDNAFDDIVREMTKLASIEIAPGIDSSSDDIKYFNTIVSNSNDIGNLTYNYCIDKFNLTHI